MCDEVDEAIDDGRAVHRAQRPRLQQGPRADPVAAHARGRAPPPHPRREPDEGRPRSSRPATCARCTTSRCSSATAPPRSTRTSPWRPARTSCAAGMITGVTPEKAVAQRHQGARQGRAEDHVEDGHLDDLAPTRAPRPSRRSASPGVHRRVLHRHDLEARRRRHRRDRGREPAPARAPPTREDAAVRAHERLDDGRRVPVAPRRTRRTSSTPRPCSGCSTRRATAGTTSSASTPRSSTTQAEELMTLRGMFALRTGTPPGRAASTRSSRSSRSSSASRPVR